MVGDLWLRGGIVALTVVQTVAVWYLYRRLAGGTTGPDSQAEESGTATVCGDCGAVNDPDYRFCASCAAELSGPGGATLLSGGLRERETR
ncbi:MAG: hypothetical protein ABEJ30_09745 [Halorientalis sp.]